MLSKTELIHTLKLRIFLVFFAGLRCWKFGKKQFSDDENRLFC